VRQDGTFSCDFTEKKIFVRKHERQRGWYKDAGAEKTQYKRLIFTSMTE